MPPKKGGKAAKKAEEAARRAEEERLAALIEQERLERERAEQEEEARRLAEEKRMWLENEGQRLSGERIEMEPLFTKRSKQLLAEEQKRFELEEWEAFINCSHLPDVRKESELSTYIALWEEDTDVDMERTLKDTEQAIDVCLALDVLISQSMAVKDMTMVDKYRNYVRKLQQLIEKKMDNATADMLEHLDGYINQKDNTCQLQKGTPNQRFGIWVNIAKNLRLKSIEHEDLGFVTDIPRPIILQTVAVRMVHYRKDPLSPMEMGDFFTVGGVLFIEVLDVPDRPKSVKAHVPDVKDPGQWAMSRITESTGDVSRQQYPAVDPITGMMQQVPPMQVSWTLPGDVLLSDAITPMVGWWNPDKKEKKGDWDEEGISDVSLEVKETGERVLNFTTLHLTAVAILQSRCACFPYKSWILQPMAPNASMLTIELVGNLSIKFEVGAGRCRLLWPNDEALRPLREKPLPAMQLLQQLVRVGINLIPSDEDAERIGSKTFPMTKCLKDKKLEEKVCLDMSLLAPSFAICCSHLNATLGPTECTVKLAESMDYQSAPLTTDDPSFRTMMFRHSDLEYCFLLEPVVESASHSEDGKIFDRDGINLAPPTVGIETKSFPISAMREVSEDMTTLRCEDSSPSFTESVRVMMDAMRLFSFVEPTLAPGTEEEAEAEAPPAEGEAEGTAPAEGEEGAQAEGGEGSAPPTADSGAEGAKETEKGKESANVSRTNSAMKEAEKAPEPTPSS